MSSMVSYGELRTIEVTPTSASDQVDTLPVGRYWSEVLCCTIMTHLDDLEVKVTDLEILR